VGVFGQITTTGAGAQAWGGNFTGFIGSGSDNTATAHGVEIDMGRLISSTAQTIGVLIVGAGSFANPPYQWMQSQSTAAAPDNGIMFAKLSTVQPVQSTGSLITTTGNPSVANGIHFSGASFTGNAYDSPGWQIDGSGNMTFTSIGVSNRIKGDF